MSNRFISFDDKIACLEREIKMRGYVYRKKVDEKKMSQDKMDLEIETMQAVLSDIKKLAGRLS
jgi:uncharacterized protein (DUF302 family)